MELATVVIKPSDERLEIRISLLGEDPCFDFTRFKEDSPSEGEDAPWLNNLSDLAEWLGTAACKLRKLDIFIDDDTILRNDMDIGWSFLESALTRPNCPVIALACTEDRMGENPGRVARSIAQIVSSPNNQLQNVCLRYKMGDSEIEDLMSAIQSEHCRVADLNLIYVWQDFATSDRAAVKIAEALSCPSCPLRSMYLTSDYLGAAGASSIAHAITIQHCQLKGLYLGLSNSVGDQVAVKFAQALAKVGQECKLELLILSSNAVGNKGAARMAHALTQCPLKKLRFWCNSIEDAGATSLAMALRSPECQLKVLHLWSPSVGHEGATSLAQALNHPAQCQLEDFSLYSCHIGDTGAASFAEALRTPHCPLRVLDLSKTGMGNVGAMHIAEALEDPCCCKLHTLNLADNNLITEAGEKRLLAALEKNNHLQQLKCSWSSESLSIRCEHLLKMNALQQSELLGEMKVVPTTAKLFICGHSAVGKTTIRKNLGRRIAPPRFLQPRNATRGIELATLSFERHAEQLVICDLGGHKEFHIFHHYFLAGSDKDLFLVVCKAPQLTQEGVQDTSGLADLHQQLRYWLRFIVSHCGGIDKKPKVIILLNFFSKNAMVQGESMSSTAEAQTKDILNDYRDVLDFVDAKQFGLDASVFGLVALHATQLRDLKKCLGTVLHDLLASRPPIPQICEHLTAFLRQPMSTGSKLPACFLFPPCSSSSRSTIRQNTHLMSLSDFIATCRKGLRGSFSEKAVTDALVLLHYMGEVIFFKEEEETQQMVILDTQWFTSEVVGALIAPASAEFKSESRREEPWIWRMEDIENRILLKCSAKREDVEKMFQYLYNLELLYPHDDHWPANSAPLPSQVIVPALLTNKEVLWPAAGVCTKRVYRGRRLQCADGDRTLLPKGVFTRLQVKLHKTYPKGYKVGDGWILLSEDAMNVIVRFGGDTGCWEDRQWIDILVRAGDQKYSLPKAEAILTFVRTQIRQICEAGTSFCPRVSLQEMVIMSQAVEGLNQVGRQQVEAVSLIEEEFRAKGHDYNHTWDFECTDQVGQLLLLGEIDGLVFKSQSKLYEIANEFGVPVSDLLLDKRKESEERSHAVPDSHEDGSNNEIFKVVTEMRRELAELRKEMHEGLADLKADIGKLAEKITEVGSEILSRCSNQLLEQMLEGNLPQYPCLAPQEDGIIAWQKLVFLAGKWVHLQFLCESPTSPHPIQNADEQKLGRSVFIPSELLTKIGPVLVPSLKVTACAAKIAACILLPGIGANFIPSFNFMDGLALQQTVLPTLLQKFAEGLDSRATQILLQSSQQTINQAELLDVLRHFLPDVVDMGAQFGLYKVRFEDRVAWVCKDHARHGRLIPNQKLPFWS